MKKRNKKGFTLAEVLITLGIIGIVAALTIPTLMANYQKVQEVAGLKKAYAEITEALKLMANDHGCPDNLACTGVFTVTDTSALGAEFKKYLKVAKDCGNTYDINDEQTKCMTDSYSMNFDGSGAKWDLNTILVGNYTFITADGFSMSVSSDGHDCKFNGANNQQNLNLTKFCGVITIDVTGLKGPNRVGRDIFQFPITTGKGPAIYPDGGAEYGPNGGGWQAADGSAQYCTASQPAGWGCAGRIMEEGWQMKY